MSLLSVLLVINTKTMDILGSKDSQMSLYHCREIPNDVAIKAGIPSNNVDIIKVIWPNK